MITKNQTKAIRYIGVLLFTIFVNLLAINMAFDFINESNTMWNIVGAITIVLLIMFDILMAFSSWNIYRRLQEMKKAGINPADLK